MANNYIDLPTGSGGGVASDVTVVDGANTLKVNPDGSININQVSSSSGAMVSSFNEVLAVANGVLTNVVSYTVPNTVTKSLLQVIAVAGTNIAAFEVLVNAMIIDKAYTYYGGGLNETFTFSTDQDQGLSLAPGDVVVIKVLHNQPYVGDFNGRIQVIEVPL